MEEEPENYSSEKAPTTPPKATAEGNKTSETTNQARSQSLCGSPATKEGIRIPT
jgi:hypothetical protein